MLAAALTMGAVLWLTQQALFATPLHGMARVGALGALIAVGLVAYGAASITFGATDWRALATQASFRRR